MKKDLRAELNKLINEKRALPSCERKKLLEKKIEELTVKINKLSDFSPDILVKYAGKVIGKLIYDTKESSWMYHANDGSVTEVAFSYEEARSWASMAGYRLKVVQ